MITTYNYHHFNSVSWFLASVEADIFNLLVRVLTFLPYIMFIFDGETLP
jgi:hypothetical protein